MSDDHYSWREHRAPDIELGDSHALWYCCWKPDVDLNPQYAGIAPVDRYSALVEHPKPDRSLCAGSIHFDTPEVAAVDAATRAHCLAKGIPYAGDYPRWKVECWEPLTVSPSLLCGCGDHGFIRAGKWVRA